MLTPAMATSCRATSSAARYRKTSSCAGARPTRRWPVIERSGGNNHQGLCASLHLHRKENHSKTLVKPQRHREHGGKTKPCDIVGTHPSGELFSADKLLISRFSLCLSGGSSGS